MKSVHLVLGTHNSQPVGTSPDRMEEVYRKAYKPFLMVLYNHPSVSVCLHYSGSLLEWMEEAHPEFITVLNEMAERKQVEILGGAYYEPFLPMIPDMDRVGQIELQTNYLRKTFGRRPRGCWLPQRVWDPSLATALKRSGMEYTFLSENDFTASGFTVRDLATPCVVEDQGKPVTILPTSREVGYLVPFGEPEEIIDAMGRFAVGDGETVLSLMIPGEKLGDRDNTHQRCYQEKWLDQFFTALEEASDRVISINPTAYLRGNTLSRPRAYFPPSTYDELMRWTRKQERINEYITDRDQIVTRSGRPPSQWSYFRQFLSVYPESRALYDRMLYTHILVNQIRGDQYRKKAAREELWRSQFHQAYWHSREGGIYRNPLRKSAYAALLEAEKITRVQGIFIPSVSSVDIDMDGVKEYLYRGHKLNGFIHTQGGILFELDHLKTSWNYLDTMSRRREPYHEDYSGELTFDSYGRRAFVDHFFQDDETLENFTHGKYREASPFFQDNYEVTGCNRDNPQVSLRAEAGVTLSRRSSRLELRKFYRFKKDGIEVSYLLTNRGTRYINGVFGAEINLSLPSEKPEEQEIFLLGDGKDVDTAKPCPLEDRVLPADDAESVQLHDVPNRTLLTLGFPGVEDVWLTPVFTHTRRGDGWEKHYQSTCLVPRWAFSLRAGEQASWNVSLFLKRS